MRSFRAILPLLLLFILYSSGCNNDNQTDFTASFSGVNEVPPVTTSATGEANFALDNDNDSIRFSVTVSNLTAPFAAHIHLGAPGVNGEGDIVVNLFNGPVVSGTFTGSLAFGTIQSGNVMGMSFDQLVANMKAGQTYVNVHTTQNPAGEIRGQIQQVN